MVAPYSTVSFGVSGSHERRRCELHAFAGHLGFVVPAALGRGLIPDVVLSHSFDSHRLFVGDAKHSESPEDRASNARLLSYALSLKRRRSPHLLAIACPARHGERWSCQLGALASDAGLVCLTEPWVRKLDSAIEFVVLEVVNPSG